MPSMEELNNIEESTKAAQQQAWGFDKKIPITLILVVVAQIVTTTWGAAKLSTTVDNYGKQLIKIESDLEHFIEKADNKFLIRAHHIQEKSAVMRELDAIKEQMHRFDNRLRSIEKS